MIIYTWDGIDPLYQSELKLFCDLSPFEGPSLLAGWE